MIVDHDKQDEERAEATLRVIHRAVEERVVDWVDPMMFDRARLLDAFMQQKHFLMQVFRAARGQP